MPSILTRETIPKEQAPLRDRLFGLSVYSALIALAMAFRRRYVGDEPECPHCKQLLRQNGKR